MPKHTNNEPLLHIDIFLSAAETKAECNNARIYMYSEILSYSEFWYFLIIAYV